MALHPLHKVKLFHIAQNSLQDLLFAYPTMPYGLLLLGPKQVHLPFSEPLCYSSVKSATLISQKVDLRFKRDKYTLNDTQSRANSPHHSFTLYIYIYLVFLFNSVFIEYLQRAKHCVGHTAESLQKSRLNDVILAFPKLITM